MSNQPGLVVVNITTRAVGYGGHSDIYQGDWKDASGELKRVAIKVFRLRPGIEGDAQNKVRNSLRHEISVWKGILHPNVLPLFGSFEGFPPAPALVSPWCKNGEIVHFVRGRASDPNIDTIKLNLLIDVMTGLTFLHGKSIVHGDIKGANILISDDEVAQLCDFGLSRILAEHSSSFTHSSTKGTQRWMAPELLRGPIQGVDRVRHSYASDIWACGCVCIEVWSGDRPYHTKILDSQAMTAIKDGELPPRPSRMPNDLWSIVLSCCSFDPSQRVATVRVLDDLQLVRSVMKRISALVVLHPPPTTLETQFLDRITSCLQFALTEKADLYHQLSLSTDEEFATRVLEYMASWLVDDPEGLQRPYDVQHLRACLDVISTEAPTRAFYPAFLLKPLARVVAAVSPARARHLIKQFGTAAVGDPFALDGTFPLHVAWFPGGKRIGVASARRSVHILDATTGADIHCFEGHRQRNVNQIVISPDGELMASCSDDETVILWKPDSVHALGTLIGGSCGRVRSIAFSPDGLHLAAGSDDHLVRVWNIETRDAAIGRSHTGAVHSVAYSPDGSTIVSGSKDHSVRIWGDIAQPRVLGCHADAVNAVAFSPSGLRVVSGSADETLRIWELSTETIVSHTLRGHEDSVLSAAYSPDGSRIISSSADSTIRLWDAEGRFPLAIIEGHKAWVWSAAFSPDGAHIASASDDGTVRIWDATGRWEDWEL